MKWWYGNQHHCQISVIKGDMSGDICGYSIMYQRDEFQTPVVDWNLHVKLMFVVLLPLSGCYFSLYLQSHQTPE